jgi:hypothetical protein
MVIGWSITMNRVARHIGATSKTKLVFTAILRQKVVLLWNLNLTVAFTRAVLREDPVHGYVSICTLLVYDTHISPSFPAHRIASRKSSTGRQLERDVRHHSCQFPWITFQWPRLLRQLGEYFSRIFTPSFLTGYIAFYRGIMEFGVFGRLSIRVVEPQLYSAALLYHFLVCYSLTGPPYSDLYLYACI